MHRDVRNDLKHNLIHHRFWLPTRAVGVVASGQATPGGLDTGTSATTRTGNDRPIPSPAD
jgi:hypothetical protein